MKRKRFAAGIACLAAVVVVASYGFIQARLSKQHGTGRLVAEPEQLEYKSNASEPGYVAITLRNCGSAALTILGFESSCSCTAADSGVGLRLKPGDRSTIRIRVRAPSFGVQESRLAIHTDSTSHGSLVVPIRLHGQKLSPPYFRKVPDEVHRLLFVDESPASVEFEVVTIERVGEAQWLTGFAASSAEISVSDPEVCELVPLGQEGVQRRYRIRVSLQMPVSARQTLAVLHPIVAQESTRALPIVPVEFSLVPALSASPSTVVFRGESIGGGASRRVVLQSKTSDKWTISSFGISADWIEVELAGSGADDHVQVFEIRMNADKTPDSTCETMVTVHTTHPKCAEIPILVYFRPSTPGLKPGE